MRNIQTTTLDNLPVSLDKMLFLSDFLFSLFLSKMLAKYMEGKGSLWKTL